MFVINEDSTQTLQINISDEYSLDYFLFALSGNGLWAEKLFFANADFAKSPRFVGFDITENTTEDLLNGVVSLPLPSDLYCSVYNVANKTLALPESDPIWEGLFRVYGTSTTINENEISKTYSGYDPT